MDQCLRQQGKEEYMYRRGVSAICALPIYMEMFYTNMQYHKKKKNTEAYDDTKAPCMSQNDEKKYDKPIHAPAREINDETPLNCPLPPLALSKVHVNAPPKSRNIILASFLDLLDCWIVAHPLVNISTGVR